MVHFRKLVQLDIEDGCLEPSHFRAFQAAFEDWALHVREAGDITQRSSMASYKVLWKVFSEWCLGQNPVVPLEAVSQGDLLEFLASRGAADGSAGDPSARYVWRLLHLIDRVLVHTALAGDVIPNRAAYELLQSQDEWRYANATPKDPLPEHLTASGARQLVNYLSGGLPRAGRRGSDNTWQSLRNRTSVALQLGAGLTPGDARALLLRSAVVEGGRVKGQPWKIMVPAHGASAERETPLAGWAGRILRHWLDVRSSLSIEGEILLPSTSTGKPWGKVSHSEAVKAVLEASGIEKSLVPGGSFRLRHTFALRQLRRNRSPEEVARWLGIVDPGILRRYNKVVFDTVGEVE